MYILCIFLDDKPYWFDVEALLSEYTELANKAFDSLKSAGKEWVQEKLEAGEDAVMKFSKGKFTMVMFISNFTMIQQKLYSQDLHRYFLNERLSLLFCLWLL